jgi:hypothetical protein
MGLSGQLQAPAALSSDKSPGTQRTGGWVDPEQAWTFWTRHSPAPMGLRTHNRLANSATLRKSRHENIPVY